MISILCISPTTCHHTFSFCGFFKQQDATPQRHLLSDTQFLEMQNTQSWDCESFSQFILVTTCESRSLSENRIPVLPKKSQSLKAEPNLVLLRNQAVTFTYAQRWPKLKITCTKETFMNIYLLSSSQAATNISAAVQQAISG